MQTASPAALDQFLDRYTTQVGGGFGAVQGDVQHVFGLLVIISLTASALLWAVDETHNVPAALIRKVMLFGFFAWLITSWHELTLTLIRGFAALGLKAGGGRMSVGDLLHSPSKVIIDGLQVAFELLKYIGRMASEGMGTGFFTHIDAIAITALAAFGIILAFVALGVHLMVTIVEFYIVTLIGFVTVPFGILTQTAFLSERAIGYVWAIGVKVMAMAIVISIGETIFTSYVVSPEPSWSESCGLLIAALAFCLLGFRIPSIAAAQISGGPQLSAGAAASAAVGVAAAVGGVALAGRWAMGGMAAGAGAKAASAQAAARTPPSGGPAAASGGSSGSSGGPAGGGPSGGSSPPGPAPGAAEAPSVSAAADGGPSDGGAHAQTPDWIDQARASYAPPDGAASRRAAPQGGDRGPRPGQTISAARAAQRPAGETPSGAGGPQIHPSTDDPT